MDILINLGVENTSDVDVIRALLFRFGVSESQPPTDAQLVEVVSALATLAIEGVVMHCDVGTVIRAFASFVSLCLFLYGHVTERLASIFSRQGLTGRQSSRHSIGQSVTVSILRH